MKRAWLMNLRKDGIDVRSQVSIPIRYEELTIENGYRLDLLVGDLVIVELEGCTFHPAGPSRAVAELSATRRLQARIYY